MKNKNNHHHHVSVHQKLERIAHHRLVLSAILGFMVLGLIKYETNLLFVIHDAYNQGFGFVSAYAHHDEVTRMPIQYGSGMRTTSTSSE